MDPTPPQHFSEIIKKFRQFYYGKAKIAKFLKNLAISLPNSRQADHFGQKSPNLAILVDSLAHPLGGLGWLKLHLVGE